MSDFEDFWLAVGDRIKIDVEIAKRSIEVRRRDQSATAKVCIPGKPGPSTPPDANKVP